MRERRRAAGGRINRAKVVTFTFNGKSMTGFEGDTLASALIANGVDLTARSFKYHRPRGLMAAGIEEPSTDVELLGDDAAGNQPVTMVALKEGLAAKSLNCWPSVGFDLGAVNQLFSRLIPASFYYKTFKWPNWHVFEPAIRKAAGLAGPPPEAPATGRFEARYWHCDVLVAGAGAAGLMAARAAARAGKRVMIADEAQEAGGSLLSRRRFIDGKPAIEWVAEVVAELAGLENVTHLQNATVWGYREHNLVLVNERSPDRAALIGRNWRVRAAQVVIATGAIERTLVFANNDRPGVMLAGAVQTYINRYGVLPGHRAVVFTNNSSAYEVAADMLAAGIEIAAIVDSRSATGAQETALVGACVIVHNAQVIKAHGYKRVTGITIRQDCGSLHRIDCDLVVMSGGWNPTSHLFSQSRGTLRYDEEKCCFIPDKPAQNADCIGAANGRFTLADAVSEGQKTGGAGQAVAKDIGAELPYSIEPLWHVDDMSTGAKGFVDVLNDVTVSDVHLALREGYGAVEHVKRYTTGGMALDQGKTGNVNIIGAIALKQGVPLNEVGTTTFRSPYSPVEFGSIGGGREGSVVLAYRHTPLTQWNIDNGCVMYEAGARWRRPGYFPRKGETFQQTVNRESACVRTGVGVYDGSPLGTFELKGVDCGRFLDLIYTNVFSSLKTGFGRYGLMLTDDGLILDDGVSFRLSENRYLMSTSTGNADVVYQWMEKLLQTQYPQWDVKITNITSQWTNATLCGPDARKVLQALDCDTDLGPEAFPFMTLRDCTVSAIPARIVRVSFTGELSFEINVAPRHLPALWEKIMAAGAPYDIMSIGSEANHVLRVEKGFLSLGHEADGTVDAYDLGMGWIMSKKKPDYLGKRSVHLRRKAGGSRQELVGIMSDDPKEMVTEGAPITPNGTRSPSEGFVTAYVWSVANNRSVGLALLEDGHSRHGETVYVRIKEKIVPVKVTAPCFYDPDGAKLRS